MSSATAVDIGNFTDYCPSLRISHVPREPLDFKYKTRIPLDVVAAWSADRRSLQVAASIPTATERQLELAIEGAVFVGNPRLGRLAASDIKTTAVVGQTPGVAVKEQTNDAHASQPAVCPWNVSIYEFPVKYDVGMK